MEISNLFIFLFDNIFMAIMMGFKYLFLSFPPLSLSLNQRLMTPSQFFLYIASPPPSLSLSPQEFILSFPEFTSIPLSHSLFL